MLLLGFPNTRENLKKKGIIKPDCSLLGNACFCVVFLPRARVVPLISASSRSLFWSLLRLCSHKLAAKWDGAAGWDSALAVSPAPVSHVEAVTWANPKAAGVSFNLHAAVYWDVVDARRLFCVSGAVISGWLTVPARVALWNQFVSSGQKQKPFNPE